MDDLSKTFQKYSQLIKLHPIKPNDDDLLYLYSHYKQATVGDCNIPQPLFFDITNRRKWDSWFAIEGMSQKESMKNLISDK